MLPFTAEVYFVTVGQFSRDTWPASFVAFFLCILALVIACWPWIWRDRLVSTILALIWVWAGLGFQMSYLSSILWAATPLGVLFVAEGLLLACLGVLRSDLKFYAPSSFAGWLGLMLALGSVACYPVFALVVGIERSQLPIVGMAPTPTALYTLGMLLLTVPRAPLFLTIVPMIWLILAAAGGWLMQSSTALLLLLVGLVAVVTLIAKRHPPTSLM